MIDKLKKCCGCKKEKPMSLFFADNSRKDRKKAWCKDCQNKWRKEYILKNKEKIFAYHKEYVKKWSQKNREKIREKGRLYYQLNKDEYKKRNKKTYFRRYGVTYENVIQKWEKQGRKCAICGMELTVLGNQIKKGLCVDHDHISGKFRGILCHNCNAGIGMFKERLDLIKKTVNYLEQDTQNA